MLKFDLWPASSAYPQGHLIQILGQVDDIHTEGEVILLEHNVEYRIFSKQVYDCLPVEGDNWQIPPEEYQKRFDFRGCNVCSIDPPGKAPVSVR